jgi:hypothetical protein
MNALSTKIVVAGALSALTLLSGVWLSHLGKPYNTVVFNIHKLIAVATIIVIAITVVGLFKVIDARTFVEMFAAAFAGVLFLALVATGGMLSINPSLSAAVLRVHQIAPLLALASSAVSIFLLAGAKP